MNSKNNSINITKTFLIGASTSIIPIFYLGLAYNRLNCDQTNLLKVKYATMIMVLPFIYGLTYTILSLLIKPEKNRWKYFLIGAIAGEWYSLIGHFGFDLPSLLFRVKDQNMVHIIAPILYSLVYGVMAYELEMKV